MLPTYVLLKTRLKAILFDKKQQGFDTKAALAQFKTLPDDYQVLDEFAHSLEQLHYRSDWPYAEPDALDDILRACDLPDTQQVKQWRQRIPNDLTKRIETGFLGSVCGCILGKPIEVDPTLAQLKTAAQTLNEWPINDYISGDLLDVLGSRHEQWRETIRENISYVAIDDDINYTLMGMLILEQFGSNFTANDIRQLWLKHLPVATTFGPERTVLTKAAIDWISEQAPEIDTVHSWGKYWNPGSELCGALIRADAYGYAYAGDPIAAAKAAYTDAAFTHIKTGVYATMFVAAAIAAAPIADTALDIFKIALKFVPARSRFYEVVHDSLNKIENAENWEQGYQAIHGKYKDYTHCAIYQEIGTLINSLHFAKDVGSAICIQVSQGNDTDSFGATCGAIAGMYFGEAGLDEKWLSPFNDKIYSGLAGFTEQSLTAVSKRVSNLQSRVNNQPKIISNSK